MIDPQSIYLCDSGAQYLDGTTDTTRTIHFGSPSDAERKAYTLVLKGNIALDMTIFPKGTTGYALDAFARQFLWVTVFQKCSTSFEVLIPYSKKVLITVTALVTAWGRISMCMRGPWALAQGSSTQRWLWQQET